MLGGVSPELHSYNIYLKLCRKSETDEICKAVFSDDIAR